MICSCETFQESLLTPLQMPRSLVVSNHSPSGAAFMQSHFPSNHYSIWLGWFQPERSELGKYVLLDKTLKPPDAVQVCQNSSELPQDPWEFCFAVMFRWALGVKSKPSAFQQIAAFQHDDGCYSHVTGVNIVADHQFLMKQCDVCFSILFRWRTRVSPWCMCSSSWITNTRWLM